MKTTMKMMAVMAVMMGFAFSAMGQTSAEITTAAKAEVVAGVTVTHVNDLIFGMVSPGVNKTITADGGVLAGAGTAGAGTTIGAEKAGQFTVTKGLNTQVTLSFGTLPTVLTHTDNSTTMNINFADASTTKLAKLGKKNGSQADLLFTPGAGIVIANSGSTQEYFIDDDFDVFIGGTVQPASDQVTGSYTGTITLTATYN